MSLMTPKVAIISPGNMGSGVGKFLVEGGFDVMAPLNDRSDFTRTRAEKLGINNSGSIGKTVEDADIILSILDPNKAIQVAKFASSAIQRLGCKKIYADCNATSPSTAIKISEMIEAAGGIFVDVGIIGGTPTKKDNFPTFFSSGPRASVLDILDGYGIRIKNLGSEVGLGSAIKICNGAWNKGAFALYTAVMLAAEKYGFTRVLRERLPNSQAGTVEKIDAALNRLPALSGRYIGEMEQVAETFAGIGIPAEFHKGAAEIFKMLNMTSLGTERRETINPDRDPLDLLGKILIELDFQEKNKQ